MRRTKLDRDRHKLKQKTATLLWQRWCGAGRDVARLVSHLEMEREWAVGALKLRIWSVAKIVVRQASTQWSPGVNHRPGWVRNYTHSLGSHLAATLGAHTPDTHSGHALRALGARTRAHSTHAGVELGPHGRVHGRRQPAPRQQVAPQQGALAGRVLVDILAWTGWRAPRVRARARSACPKCMLVVAALPVPLPGEGWVGCLQEAAPEGSL